MILVYVANSFQKKKPKQTEKENSDNSNGKEYIFDFRQRCKVVFMFNLGLL